MWKRSSLGLLLPLLLNAAGGERFERAQPHMGTLFRITLYADSEPAATQAFEAAFARVAELDAILSDYKDDSEAMRLCRTANTAPVRVSEELFTVLAAARQLSEQTGGAFDVTLGPVIRLWRKHRVPASEELAAASPRCGYRNVVLDPANRTVYLRRPDMLLDFGAIAKGYAADEALRILRIHGITRALVAASGDLAIGDAPPGQSGWRVGIDSFRSPARQYTRILTLRNIAVSTSGDTEQFVESGGNRYSHIVDPHTNLGLTRRIGVSVVARRGIDADSLATALSVLGVERGLRLIDRRSDAAALFVTADGERESSQFREMTQTH